MVERVHFAKWYMPKVTSGILSRRRALEDFGVPGISRSVSFSFEPRNRLDLVFLLVVPDVAYFCVDAIVNLLTLKNTF